MLANEVVQIAQKTLQHLEAQGPAPRPPIIAMTKIFGREMASQLLPDAEIPEEGAEPDEIAGIKVVYRDDAVDPVLITHDGRLYSLLPEWAQKKAATSRLLKLPEDAPTLMSKLLSRARRMH